MAKADYIFDKTQDRRERARLRTIEHYHDPATRRRLGATGIRPGWRCLEVGPGAGSIMRWMASVVGKKGHVVALDINPRFIAGTHLPNVEILREDIRKARLPPRSFHVVHARNVLIHIADFRTALGKMVDALRPGGWILLEEPDFSAARAISGRRPYCRSIDRVNQAILYLFQERGLNPAFGTRLPSLLQESGLSTLTIENDVPLSPGGSRMATIMKLSAHQLREPYLATGKASRTDIERYCRFAEDPRSWAVYHATVAAAGRKMRRGRR